MQRARWWPIYGRDDQRHSCLNTFISFYEALGQSTSKRKAQDDTKHTGYSYKTSSGNHASVLLLHLARDEHHWNLNV